MNSLLIIIIINLSVQGFASQPSCSELFASSHVDSNRLFRMAEFTMRINDESTWMYEVKREITKSASVASDIADATQSIEAALENRHPKLEISQNSVKAARLQELRLIWVVI